MDQAGGRRSTSWWPSGPTATPWTRPGSARVEATGTYDADETVVVRNRSQDGRGRGLARHPAHAGQRRAGAASSAGFVGLADDRSIPQPAPPGGQVTVTGLAMDPDRLGGTAGKDLDGLLATTACCRCSCRPRRPTLPDAGPGADGGRTATAGAPAPSDAAAEAGLVTCPPRAVGRARTSATRSQWFIFSTIALVGYPIILRRCRRPPGQGGRRRQRRRPRRRRGRRHGDPTRPRAGGPRPRGPADPVAAPAGPPACASSRRPTTASPARAWRRSRSTPRAQEAGVARATVYRHFPGGRDELISAVVGWEVEPVLLRRAGRRSATSPTSSPTSSGGWPPPAAGFRPTRCCSTR